MIDNTDTTWNSWTSDNSGSHITINGNDTGPYVVGSDTISMNGVPTLSIRGEDGEEVTGDELILMKKYLEKDEDFLKFKKLQEIKKKLKENS